MPQLTITASFRRAHAQTGFMLVLAAWLVMPLAMAQQTAELAAKTTGAQSAEPVRRVVGPAGEGKQAEKFPSAPAQEPQEEKTPGLAPVPLPRLLIDNVSKQSDIAFLLGKNLYQRWEAAVEAADSAKAKQGTKEKQTSGRKNTAGPKAKPVLVDDKYPAEAVLQQALYWLQQAAGQGHGEAALMLGQHAATQDDNANALDWFQLAGQRHVAKALQSLGNVYLSGLLGQAPDCHKAAQYYAQAEKLGEPWSFNNHAWILATAMDKACRNPEKAMRLWSALDWESVPDNAYAVASFRDTEAAIHAALRDYPSAIAAQQNAIDLMRQEVDEDNELLGEMRQRLDHYRAGKPWFESDIVSASGQAAKE